MPLADHLHASLLTTARRRSACTVAISELHGRPLEFYTDKASLFEVAPKQQDKWEGEQLPRTQITRALVELGIGRISAHTHKPKGGLSVVLPRRKIAW